LYYAGNIDDDPRLAGLDPREVYNAVEVRLNELQFRERSEDDLVRAMDGGGAVTLVIGDSFCFGQGVRQQDRFSDIVQARLGARGLDHTVYNMCVPGMNIQRIARVQREAVKRFGPPTRILYSYTLNDPIRDAQTWEMEDSIYDLMHFRRSQFEVMHWSPLWRSAALRWLMERRTRRQVAEQTVVWYQRLYGDNPGWRQTAKVLADMEAFCAERGIEFALAVFPILHQLGDYPLQAAHRKLSAQGIHVVDLLEVFVGEDERAYWVHPTDFHPNGRAHRLAAEHLLKTLAW
jgi:lysophospholipase L1-like esterase